MKTTLIAAVVAAVVAAASGTAATIVVTSKNIKNGTIQTVDISTKAQRALKGNRGLRGAAGAPGPPGPPGAQGIQGPPGIQRLRFIVSPTITIQPNSSAKADAVCPAGETAVSGGYLLTGSEAALFQSVGIGTAWQAQAENSAAATDVAQLTAYAYCSPNVSFVP